MELVVDLSTGGVELRHRDEMEKFSVLVHLHDDDDGEDGRPRRLGRSPERA